MTARLNTAILISGRGSNMAALIAAARHQDFPAQIRCVIADRAEATGLTRASEAGIETAILDYRTLKRTGFENALDTLLRDREIELVCLAGFMRILSAAFLSGWQGRILNIHPSLLPAYKGLNTHARAIADGATEHGCTVHWVTPELDSGEIVAQARVSIAPGDSAKSLADRVLLAEHRLYPRALADVANGLLMHRK